MVVSNDKWEREKQQKDFEFREEMILDSKAMYGRAILEDTPFNPWVKDYIRVDRCCLHFTCDACEEAGSGSNLSAIALNLDACANIYEIRNTMPTRYLGCIDTQDGYDPIGDRGCASTRLAPP